jgi:hypothetical protein
MWRQPGVAIAAVVVVAITGLGRRSLRRGRTRHGDNARRLPGDDLIPDVDQVSTRSITIEARTDGVWPWIAQIGQGRGGFYSYDFLENLAHCDIHSADQINAVWQDLAVGDPIRLAPELALTAVVVDPGSALVLRGSVPIGPGTMPFDFTWAFVLEPSMSASTRLTVRERYQYLRWWTPLIVKPTALISSVMTRQMMRGIKRRAEVAAWTTSGPFGHDDVMAT